MAIADRPIQGGNGGGISPYLAAGTSRVGRAPWEDELNKLLLGIPQSEWGSIRAGLGLSPGGGYAPGGVQAGTAAAASAAGAAPAALMVGSVPAGGATGTEGLGGSPEAGNVNSYGQTTDVLGVLGTIGGFALGPVGTALALGANMIGGRTSSYGLSDMFSGKPTSLTGMISDQWNGNLVDPNIAAPGKAESLADYGKADYGADFSGTVGGPDGKGGGEVGGPSQNAENNAPDAGKGDGGKDGGSKGWRKGGYTGAGRDGVVQPGRPAGTVHEGELVLNANAVRSLPPELLALLGHFNAAGRTGKEGPGYEEGGLVGAPFGLTPAEAATFQPPSAPPQGVTLADYAGRAGRAAVEVGRALLPPTPNEYMLGMTGYDIPRGAEVRPGIDGYGAEYRQPGGDWQPAERSGMAFLSSFLAPLGFGPAPEGAIASGVPVYRKISQEAADAASHAPHQDWLRREIMAVQAEQYARALGLDATHLGPGGSHGSLYLTLRKVGEPGGPQMRFADHPVPNRGWGEPRQFGFGWQSTSQGGAAELSTADKLARAIEDIARQTPAEQMGRRYPPRAE